MQQHVKFSEKGSQKSLTVITTIKKLETIAILQVNTKTQHIIYIN